MNGTAEITDFYCLEHVAMAGCVSGQPGLVEDVPIHCMGLE